MTILTPINMTLEQQKQSLFIQANEFFRTRQWLDSKGNLKKAIFYRKKNIRLEEIRMRFVQWSKDPKVLLMVLTFDAHFKTEEEEAIRHKTTYWALNADPTYNIKTLGTQLDMVDAEIRLQLVFTDMIDMNLYNYYELEKKGWQIIKRKEKNNENSNY